MLQVFSHNIILKKDNIKTRVSLFTYSLILQSKHIDYMLSTLYIIFDVCIPVSSMKGKYRDTWYPEWKVVDITCFENDKLTS